MRQPLHRPRITASAENTVQHSAARPVGHCGETNLCVRSSDWRPLVAMFRHPHGTTNCSHECKEPKNLVDAFRAKSADMRRRNSGNGTMCPSRRFCPTGEHNSNTTRRNVQTALYSLVTHNPARCYTAPGEEWHIPSFNAQPKAPACLGTATKKAGGPTCGRCPAGR